MPLLVFLILAVCVSLILISGADAYRRILDRDGLSYDKRTVSQYVCTRIRSADAPDMLFISSFDGEEKTTSEGDTLFIREEIEGTVYLTRIYCHDGFLCELFAESGYDFSPEDGERLVPAEALDLAMGDGYVSVVISHRDGSSEGLTVAINSGTEVAK